MTDKFSIDPKLAADTHPVARLGLCAVRLMNDRRFPWVVLIPERAGLRDLHDVASADQAPLFAEIAKVSRALAEITGAHKMNVAALGNQVFQLHVHVIARFTTDSAWPAPIWGTGAAVAYPPTDLEVFSARLAAGLAR